MKLLNDLFRIVDDVATESGFSTTIKFFPDHVIYLGHFPGHPVTPGVVQMQIVHELMENHFGRCLKLISIDDCKFLKILNPEEYGEIEILVTCVEMDSLFHVKAMGKRGSDTFFKLRGSYRPI